MDTEYENELKDRMENLSDHQCGEKSAMKNFTMRKLGKHSRGITFKEKKVALPNALTS